MNLLLYICLFHMWIPLCLCLCASLLQNHFCKSTHCWWLGFSAHPCFMHGSLFNHMTCMEGLGIYTQETGYCSSVSYRANDYSYDESPWVTISRPYWPRLKYSRCPLQALEFDANIKVKAIKAVWRLCTFAYNYDMLKMSITAMVPRLFWIFFAIIFHSSMTRLAKIFSLCSSHRLTGTSSNHRH